MQLRHWLMLRPGPRGTQSLLSSARPFFVSMSLFDEGLCMATVIKITTTRDGGSPSAPASRASWCGQIRIGDFSVPVKAYAAIATPPETPLRQLHAGCGQRIEYRKWCPKHGAVSPDEIVKGYPYQPEQYVELSQSELDQMYPADDKTIHLEHFLKPSCFDPILFAGRSLYLAAANPAARHPFVIVQRALDRSKKWGLGRVILSKRWTIVIVRPTENTLLMHTLHHPTQARAVPATETPEARVTQTELRPITQTINRLNGNVNWDSYMDDAERRLVKVVQAKVVAIKRSKSSRTNGKQRVRNGRSTNGTKPSASTDSARRRRTAA
jgi:DNA end-binding protein Ku